MNTFFFFFFAYENEFSIHFRQIKTFVREQSSHRNDCHLTELYFCDFLYFSHLKEGVWPCELRDIRNGDNFILHKDWSNVNSAPITICDDAWIGMNCIILKGVTIGEGAIVGAGSVVTKDVPAWTVVAGNPARVVKKISK